MEFAGVEFDPVVVEVTPQSPLLPDILPSRSVSDDYYCVDLLTCSLYSRYSVCGAVTITSKTKVLNIDVFSVQFLCVLQSAGYSVEASAQSLSKPITTTTKSDGAFCFMLPSGSYTVKVCCLYTVDRIFMHFTYKGSC